jgi:hypothetical protein
MFIVNPMPEQIGADIIELLEKVEVATIGHVLHSGPFFRASAWRAPPSRCASRMRIRPCFTT